MRSDMRVGCTFCKATEKSETNLCSRVIFLHYMWHSVSFSFFCE